MTELRMVIIEDNNDDALLIVDALQVAGMDVDHVRVETAEELAAELAARRPDLVLSDYAMPGFTAEQGLKVVRELVGDVPFLLVSGQIEDEAAAALLRAGAHDFVRKDHLGRLAPAVLRELREAEGRLQRRHAEAALRASEERFRLLAEHARDAIFLCRLDPRPVVEYVSPAIEGMTGYPPDELTGDADRIWRLAHPEDRARLEESWRSADPEALVVTRWRHRDGSTTWSEQRTVGIQDATGHVVVVEGILRDITERVLAEQERERLTRKLQQAERMEVVGQLAGGIAHDFNNLLAVILGSAAFVADDLPPDDSRIPDLERVIHAAERAADLTRQLLIFSRMKPTQLETLDLNEVVSSIEGLLRRTIGEDIEFACRLVPGSARIMIDRSRLEQVIVNLVVNSRAAMPEGGSLTIETVRVETPGEGVPDLPLPPGSYVRLTVSDTGCGMPPEVAERAFEPFFTTKGPFKGTGLGLATAHGVVKEAGGHIAIDSAPGEGTSIHVYLPETDAEVSAPAPSAETPPQGRTETVLVVEDDEQVRQVVTRILTQNHYQVISMGSPTDALRLSEDPATRFDALLTDLIMPGMPGTELAERVRLIRPGLPVVYMSGYAADHLPDEQSLGGHATLVHKPFGASTLLRRLREVIDRSGDVPGALPPAARPKAAFPAGTGSDLGGRT